MSVKNHKKKTFSKTQRAAKSYSTYSRKCLCTQLFYQQCSLQNGNVPFFWKCCILKRSLCKIEDLFVCLKRTKRTKKWTWDWVWYDMWVLDRENHVILLSIWSVFGDVQLIENIIVCYRGAIQRGENCAIKLSLKHFVKILGSR